MRCRTIASILTLACGILVTSLLADAQLPAQCTRIGFLGNVPPPIFEAFRQGLRDLGYIEGQSLTIEHRGVEGKEERLSDLAAELVRRQVAVIVAPGPVAVQAAKQATATIPIVMVAGTDPVAEGWVASLARPGGNITGVSVAVGHDLAGKWLELLTEAAPGVRRVAVLFDTSMAPSALKHLEAPARALGVEVQALGVQGPTDLDEAFAAATKEQVGAVLVWTTPMLHVSQGRIMDLLRQHRLPAIAVFRDFAESGGLLAYGPNLPELFRRAASYVDRILKGAPPAGLPVEQPRKFELIINLKTAQALGITLPPSLLLLADAVIQ
jgi:putative ABC transport system substrate-binding protein